jgi:DNA invertase Pin-like site-specific DNA recombinase
MSRPKKIRCAIYTRKSHEEGLDQDFNSLDAQRESCEAYIKSQKHEGWEVIPTLYDDGGFSGGNMERPALKKLLADIESGEIDIVVVYKVDRLSRALSDFAKMVEVFDSNNVSFVSVTQQFNTTTSMGRLTLNVLLSFAQFEREVTGERIRDKFAASKKKGMWMGGPQPLGYDVVDRKLIINKDEAEIIRFIYEYYLNNKKGEPLWKLLEILKNKGWKNKSYTSQKGNKIIGKDFTLNQIYSILRNPLYNGKMKHKSEIYEGEHKAIIEDELWNLAQEKISKKDFVRNPTKKSEQSRLVGKLYDYLESKLRPTYSYKYYADGRRYKMRYFINRDIDKKGKTISEFKRIRADYIEKVIEDELTIIIENKITDLTASKNHELVSKNLKDLQDAKAEPLDFLVKAVLFPDHIEMHLADETKINISAQYKKMSGQLHIITENGKLEEDKVEAEYYHPDDKTFNFIAKSFYWNKMLDEGVYDNLVEISKAERQNLKYVKRAIRQRFLSPNIVKAITSNNNSEIGVEALSNLTSWDWKVQEKALLK